MASTSISLAELTDIPRLGLSVVAGASGLHRQVTWTHVSELADPSPWLEGGELLLSAGIGFPQSPVAQVEYIDRLARRGVAAFGLNAGAPRRLSQKMQRQADELSFPVFTVARETPFVEVVRTVAMANEQVSRRRLLTHLHIFDSLQARLVEGLDTAELFARIGRFAGYDIYLGATDGLELLEGVPVPPANVTTNLPDCFERPVAVGNGYAVPLVLDGEMVGQMVALERPGGLPMGLVALQHVATVVAFEIDRRHQTERVADAYRAGTLRDILTGELRPEATRRHLQEEGLDADEPLVLAALSAEGDNAPDQKSIDRWCARLRRIGVPHLMTRLDCVYVLVPDRAPAIEVLQANAVFVGVSRAFRLRDGHGLARRESALALHAATSSGRSLVRWGADVEHPVSLPADQDSLERLVAAVLGRVNDYDRAHHTDLVASLRSYLEHDRAVRTAAKELFIHPNSLAYRLRRVEEITGKRLSSVKAQTDFWMALEAQRVLAISGEDGRSNGTSPHSTAVS